MLKGFAYFIIMIDPVDFDKCVSIMRTFFKVKGCIEVYPQHLSILVCEDPQTITTFQYENQLWPLPQTGKIWLEYEMLKDHSPGYFCVSTCYRNSSILPMFEFELKGGLDKMIELEHQLLEFMGFKTNDYTEVCLTDIPNHMWTISQKSVIIHGIETITLAEHSTDPIDMRNRFNRDNLYNIFGKRVEDELDLFLNHTFIERSCGGIDITQMVRVMKLSNLM